MKTERSIKELLELMLEHPELYEKHKLGLCHWSLALKHQDLISATEDARLFIYITQNRPSKYSSIKAYRNRNRTFYWEEGDITPRIKWIKKHIKLNS